MIPNHGVVDLRPPCVKLGIVRPSGVTTNVWVPLDVLLVRTENPVFVDGLSWFDLRDPSCSTDHSIFLVSEKIHTTYACVRAYVCARVCACVT